MVSLKVGDVVPTAAAVTAAIIHAEENDIRILNISLVVNETTEMNDAINAFNGLIVVSVGNYPDIFNGGTGTYPATLNNPRIISVGSISSDNSRSDFSRWNPAHIWAPGDDILSTWPSAMTDHDQGRPGYKTISGTSMAAPYVTGVAALMLSVDDNLTFQQLRANLINNSDTINITHPSGFLWLGSTTISVRRLNAQAAVKAIATFDTKVLTDTTIEVRGVAGNGTLYGTYTIPATLNGRSLVQIGNSSFANQTQLTQITIPTSVTRMGSNAFKNTNNALIYLNGRTSVPVYFDINWNSSVNPVYLNGTLCTHSSKTTIELSDTQHGDLCNHCRTLTNKMSHRKYTLGEWQYCHDCPYSKFLGHTHSYTYTWLNLQEHKRSCSCGDSRTTAHIISGPWNGSGYTCIACGGPADSGLIINGVDHTSYTESFSSHINQYFGNGSFILNNGVIVLSELDLIKYYDGTLILPYECNGLDCCSKAINLNECFDCCNDFINEVSTINYNSNKDLYLPCRREYYISISQ